MRSKLERTVNKLLERNKVKAAYEKDYLNYTVPARKASYNPDFTLPNGIFVEVKGKLDMDARRKMKLVREANPDADIRFIFDRNNLLRKKGKHRYDWWCRMNGYPHFTFMYPNKDLGQEQEWFDTLMEWANEKNRRTRKKAK